MYLYLGPTNNSIEDFWRMIWEGNIPTIVMLTRIFEGKVRWISYCAKWDQLPNFLCGKETFFITMIEKM